VDKRSREESDEKKSVDGDEMRMGWGFIVVFSSRFRFLRGSTSCVEVDTDTIPIRLNDEDADDIYISNINVDYLFIILMMMNEFFVFECEIFAD